MNTTKKTLLERIPIAFKYLFLNKRAPLIGHTVVTMDVETPKDKKGMWISITQELSFDELGQYMVNKLSVDGKKKQFGVSDFSLKADNKALVHFPNV